MRNKNLTGQNLIISSIGGLIQKSASFTNDTDYHEITNFLADTKDDTRNVFQKAVAIDKAVDGDKEDDIANLLIVSTLVVIGVLSNFHIFGRYLLFPFESFLPLLGGEIRIIAYGLMVSTLMLLLGALAIILSGRMPLLSISISLITGVCISQLLAIFEVMYPSISGITSLTMAGIAMAWIIIDALAGGHRFVIQMSGAVIILTTMFVTDNYGLITNIILNLSLPQDQLLNPISIVDLLILSMLWFISVFFVGLAASSFSMLPSPKRCPLKVSALFISSAIMIMWFGWFLVLIKVIKPYSRNNSSQQDKQS